MKKIIAIILSVITIVFSMSSCKIAEQNGNIKENSKGVSDDSFYSLNNEISDTSSFLKDSETVEQNRKIIEYITLDVQTKNYPEFINEISKEISTLGGYIENSEVYDSGINRTSNRYATFKIRIPSDKSTELTNFISESGIVTRKETTTDDVTLQYVDTESRIKALNTEKEALEKMLSEADKIESVITIRDRLSDIIYEIESYESTLRTLDNLIDYTTVTLNISEVERTLVVEEQTLWQEIGTNLKNNFSDVANIITKLFIFILSATPYFLLIGIPGVIILFIIYTNVKRKKKKSDKNSKTEKSDFDKNSKNGINE